MKLVFTFSLLISSVLYLEVDRANAQSMTCPQGPQGNNGNNGVPGNNGMPGSPGRDGRDAKGEPGPTGDRGEAGPKGNSGESGPKGNSGEGGPKGNSGEGGPKGNSGEAGPKGNSGEGGPKGNSGEGGPKGNSGEAGPKGNSGEAGPKGNSGEAGSKGDRGEAGPKSTFPGTNWKQCVWKRDDDKDNGLIQECIFNKKNIITSLRVFFDGTLRINSCTSCCKRWYFTFNGAECSGPMTIEGIVYTDKSNNIHRHRHIEGYCNNIAVKGRVRVGFWVGNCASFGNADAYTGYNAVSRIVIEETSPQQL